MKEIFNNPYVVNILCNIVGGIVVGIILLVFSPKIEALKKTSKMLTTTS